MDDIEGLVPLSDGDDLPVAPERLEESLEWVIDTYRKHQSNRVTSWLNENLGKGRRKKKSDTPDIIGHKSDHSPTKLA